MTEIVKMEHTRSIEKITDLMIASTSHDMRTPLNTIISMLKVIDSKLKDTEIIELIKVAGTSCSLLLFLVNDTLDYYQIKSGKFDLRESEFKV